MKNITFLFLCSLLILSTNVFAQQGGDSSQADRSRKISTYKCLKKGTFTFTLNGSANNSKQKAGWSLAPQAGYLITNRLVVGLQLSLANRFLKQERNWGSLKSGGVKEYAFTPEVYGRYYVLPFRFTPFIQWSTGYNIGEFRMANDGFLGQKSSISTNNYVMFGAIGLSLKVGKNMGVQAQYNLPLVVDSKTNDMIRGNRFRLGLALYIK